MRTYWNWNGELNSMAHFWGENKCLDEDLRMSQSELILKLLNLHWFSFNNKQPFKYNSKNWRCSCLSPKQLHIEKIVTCALIARATKNRQKVALMCLFYLWFVTIQIFTIWRTQMNLWNYRTIGIRQLKKRQFEPWYILERLKPGSGGFT